MKNKTCPKCKQFILEKLLREKTSCEQQLKQYKQNIYELGCNLIIINDKIKKNETNIRKPGVPSRQQMYEILKARSLQLQSGEMEE